jgi:hypothetical protein
VCAALFFGVSVVVGSEKRRRKSNDDDDDDEGAHSFSTSQALERIDKLRVDGRT